MGNAVHIAAPPPEVRELSEADTQEALGRFYDDDIAMRFRSMAANPRWVRTQPTPFEEARWVKEDAGRITREQFDGLVERARYTAEHTTPPQVKAQVELSVVTLQRSARSRRERALLEAQLKHVTTIQRTMRGAIVRKALAKQRASAVQIQRVFKRVSHIVRHKAATLIQARERRRQAKNRMAMQHARKLAEMDETLVGTIVTKKAEVQEVKLKGLILSLPYPWCEMREAAMAQHVYDGLDETSTVDGLAAAGAMDASLSVGDVFVWLFGALVQLENLSAPYSEYKEAIKVLLCQSVLWRDGESNSREKNFVALQQHADWRIKKLSSGLENRLYTVMELASSFAVYDDIARDNRDFVQEDIIPTPYHADQKHESRTSKQYFLIVLLYLAMAADHRFQQLTRDIAGDTDGEHYCAKGVKRVSRMLQELQHRESRRGLEGLQQGPAGGSGGKGSQGNNSTTTNNNSNGASRGGAGSGGTRVSDNCDVIRCAITYDSAEQLRQGYDAIARSAAAVHVRSSMGRTQDLAATLGNRDVTVLVEYRPAGALWEELFEAPETQRAWKAWEARNQGLTWYIQQVRNFLQSGEVRRQAVAIIGEVRLSLRQYRNFFKCTKLYRQILLSRNPLQLMHTIEPEAEDVHDDKHRARSATVRSPVGKKKTKKSPARSRSSSARRGGRANGKAGHRPSKSRSPPSQSRSTSRSPQRGAVSP